MNSRVAQWFRRGPIAVAALLVLLCLTAAPAPAAPAPTPSATATAAADPVAAATAAIGHAAAALPPIAAEARRAVGPITSGRLIARADAAAGEARRGVDALVAMLADPHLAAPRRAAVVAQIARGGRVANAADALAARIRSSPAQQVARSALTRVDSPFDRAFWAAAAAALPADLARFGRFMAAQADATWRGVTGGGVWIGLVGLLGAIALMFPVRLGLRRRGQRFMIDRIPQSRLRRSGWALWIALLGAVVPWLAVLVLYEGFRAGGMVAAAWRPFAVVIVEGVAIAAAISSVAGALLLRGQGSWRLLPMSNESVAEVRPWTIVAAVATFVTVGVDGLIAAAAISPAGRDVANAGEALLHVVVSVLLLLAIGRARRRADAAADAEEARAEQDGADATTAAKPDKAGGDDGRRGLIAVAVVALIGWLVVAGTLGALASGYVALALLAVRLLVWLPLVGASLYLAWLVIDDLASELVSGDSALGRSLHRGFGVRTSVVDQVGVVLSAAVRVLLLVVAGIAAFAPFGSNLGELGLLAHGIAHGVTIGQITVAPGAILRGLVVLMIALFVVHLVERWLAERYLPATELDAGARNSISTVARYIGLLLACSWALAAFGIGFERIALVLSALSVGIGFGLQAITQNFVSGLILLIERPVKLGDLIEIGGNQKGDVKRISVRATEIMAADRSTLIVPNSELITKTIRNLTHADPMGVVQLKFTVPLDSDVDAVRQLVLSLFKEAKTVFDTPEPKAMIDSIDDGAVHFACTAYCSSPRAAYSTRSEVLFRLIMAMRERGIPLGSSTSAAAAGPGAAPAPSPGSSGVVGHDH